MQTNERTDTELLAILDRPGTWHVRGGRAGILDTGVNLQSALTMAYERHRAGEIVQGIVKAPADAITLSPDQIVRLWKHFRFVDAYGNLV
jgi:hypothetical protein